MQYQSIRRIRTRLRVTEGKKWVWRLDAVPSALRAPIWLYLISTKPTFVSGGIQGREYALAVAADTTGSSRLALSAQIRARTSRKSFPRSVGESISARTKAKTISSVVAERTSMHTSDLATLGELVCEV